MRLKSLVLLVGILPLAVAITAVVVVVGAQLQSLAGTQKEAVASILNRVPPANLHELTM